MKNIIRSLVLIAMVCNLAGIYSYELKPVSDNMAMSFNMNSKEEPLPGEH